MKLSASRERGLTIIELLIGMVLGLLVLAGVIQIFLSGNRSYSVQEGLGRVQETGRFADFYLSRVLREAGRPWVIGSSDGLPGPFFMPIDNRVGSDGQPLTRDGTPNGNGPDAITVMYQSDTNCLGNSTDYGAAAIRDFSGNLYARDQFLLDDANPPNLVCQGIGLNGAPVAGHRQPLVGGVDDFQVLYGIDTTGDGQANRFDNATNLAANEWLSIVSLRFALLVSSDRPVKSTNTADPHPFVVLDAPLRGPYSDGRLRQVFESTIELRNRSR
ncbi:MAG: PilW family protein [Oceanococcaceae bacterium]